MLQDMFGAPEMHSELIVSQVAQIPVHKVRNLVSGMYDNQWLRTPRSNHTKGNYLVVAIQFTQLSAAPA